MNKVVFLFVSLAVLGGCAKNDTLYVWKNYEPGVYDSLQGKQANMDKQIAKMEETIHASKGSDQKIPPGFYAHLGLLYGKTGAEDKMRNNFEMEKQLFPESEHYMNFLLSSKKQSKKKTKEELS